MTYTYDNDGRRTAMGGTWARMSLPSPTNSSAVYNAANELTQWNGVNLTYDANGNLTGDGLNNYTWNERNQLATVKDVNTGTTLASFAYDSFGRRLQNSGGDRVLYDGANEVQELSGTTPVVIRLTGGLDEFFSRTDSAGTTFPLTDALGSTIALTDSTGTVQTQYTYDPFGGATATGAMSTNTYEFTGRENDGTGLYYYRARHYSPTYQRFISEDPLKFHGGGPNLYSYALDSPAVYSDPTGLHVHCDFCQNTGGLTCVDTDTSKTLLDTKGYSGGNEGKEPWCVNNPFCEPFGDTGPIPQGTYYIGPAYKSPKLGPVTFNLTPTDDTNTFGRGPFRIHAPNNKHDFDSPGWPPFGQNSSEGCIVTPKWVRDKLAQDREKGDTLDVNNCE